MLKFSYTETDSIANTHSDRDLLKIFGKIFEIFVIKSKLENTM